MYKIMLLLVAMFASLGLLAAPRQGASTQEKAASSQKAAKEDRVSGTIIRSNKDKSSLIVREGRSKIERTVVYNASTKWTKGKESADMNDFKDGTYVICLGKMDEKGELTATRIDFQEKTRP